MTCRICGADLPEGAMFCGECGSSTSATPESRRRPDPRPGDTTAIERPARRNSGVVSIPVHGFRAVGDDDARAEAGVARVLDEAAASASAYAGDERADAAIARVLDAAASSALAAPGATAPSTDAAPSARSGSRFVLAFSTGETRTVFGTGLIGRRPLPQPGEAFDHLVQIADRTLSVSKTHLEFGEHEGELWIADRFSGNGTIVRRPDDGALRCEPGRRYLVPRGSLVELAEQSFTVA
ncbi:zinc-ribbon domain-containing protein [Agromyces mariniharenae]|uniref:Zinc ribbon domain-containing protein n=1 Tax=Agromyces mariniharenae TaxID=2604423 RepID=A0A5S4V301_9MICO|nr:zinc-ribbon domain-containing protein [Agromyces mariniharenae]TYL52389.1 zinc ribbon domain-containing protein [Agromyces mariniharenae]